MRRVQVTSSRVEVIEDHPIIPAHSEVYAVELALREGWILQVGLSNQRLGPRASQFSAGTMSDQIASTMSVVGPR